jgi:hypothetical protein
MQNARVHRIEYIFVPTSFGASPQGAVRMQKPSYPRRSRVRDLSLGGLFVETAKSKAVGASVKLNFLVQEGPIGAEAVVRHVKSDGLGLKVSAMRNEDQKRLKALIARLRK